MKETPCGHESCFIWRNWVHSLHGNQISAAFCDPISMATQAPQIHPWAESGPWAEPGPLARLSSLTSLENAPFVNKISPRGRISPPPPESRPPPGVVRSSPWDRSLPRSLLLLLPSPGLAVLCLPSPLPVPPRLLVVHHPLAPLDPPPDSGPSLPWAGCALLTFSPSCTPQAPGCSSPSCPPGSAPRLWSFPPLGWLYSAHPLAPPWIRPRPLWLLLAVHPNTTHCYLPAAVCLHPPRVSFLFSPHRSYRAASHRLRHSGRLCTLGAASLHKDAALIDVCRVQHPSVGSGIRAMPVHLCKNPAPVDLQRPEPAPVNLVSLHPWSAFSPCGLGPGHSTHSLSTIHNPIVLYRSVNFHRDPVPKGLVKGRSHHGITLSPISHRNATH